MFGFKKKRHVGFILPANPEDNKPPEKEDKDIQIDMSQNMALGPAATAEDERNYSSGNMIGSPASYYNLAQGIGSQQPMQQQSQQESQINSDLFVPFIPDGTIANNSSTPTPDSEVIYLKRKVDELIDKIYLLEMKIEKLEKNK